MSSLRVTLVQTHIHWMDPEKNFAQIEDLLLKHETSDLIVLPETFATGFAVEEKQVLAHVDKAAAYLKSCAKRFNAVVTGSVLCQHNGKIANRMLWCTSRGEVLEYDKRHLFCLGKEQENGEAGRQRKIFEINGFRILPQICYDLRFPVFQRNRDDYDVMLNIANWPAKRRAHWDTLLTARAIENQCYVIAVNRIGLDKAGVSHSGGTKAIDFYGNNIGCIEDDKRAALSITLHKDKLQQYKAAFPCHLDADEFTLTLNQR